MRVASLTVGRVKGGGSVAGRIYHDIRDRGPGGRRTDDGGAKIVFYALIAFI